MASLVAAFLVPVLTIALGEPLPYKIAGVLVAIVVWWAHRGNIRRLLAGEEHRVKLPWSGDARSTAGSERRRDMRVTVIGSGSWGSAFARLLVRRGHDAEVLALTREEAARLQATHENPHFLPGVRLPKEIRFAGMDDADLCAADLLVYAVPTQAVRDVARWVAPRRPQGALQLSLAKGYEIGSLKRPTQVIEEETGAGAAALSGPNHAEEVSKDMPSATVIAAADEAWRSHSRRPSPATPSACTPTTTSWAWSSAALSRTPSPWPSACPTASGSVTTPAPA